MTNTNFNDNIFASGDDWPVIPMQILQNDGITPLDLTDWPPNSIVFYVYSPNSNTPLFSVTAVIDTPSTGSIHIPSAPAASTARCTVAVHQNPTGYYWDVLRTDTGNVTTLGYGNIPVRL